MPRVLGKSVTIADSVVDKVPQGRVHTILLDDSEEVPTSAEAVEEFLAREEADIVAEKTLEAAFDIEEKDAEDPAKRVLATLDALAADDTKESTDWKKERMGTDAEGAGPVAAEEVKE